MTTSTPSTTTQITKTELPEWVDQAAQSNYQLAQSIAAKPYEAYTGQLVADQSPLSTQAYGLLASGAGADTTGYNAASSIYDSTKNGILGMDRDAYTNPYTQDVVNATVQTSQDALNQALQANADKAIAAKAFGGSRSAIVDGVTTAQANKDLSALVAQLNSAGYDKATSAMQSDLASQLQTAEGYTANQSAANTDALKNVTGLLTAGAADTAQQQAVLDAAKGQWDEAQNYDTEQLNVLLSALGMSPYGSSTDSTKTSTGGTSGTDWGTTSLGLLSLFLGLSDRDEKTDIKKLGKDPTTGIDLYAYRYKDDPKTYPKVVGPMAQDIERKFPGTVKKVGGKRVINYSALRAKMA